MTERMKERLGDLKARQDAGEHMLCPRCGKDAMKEPVHTNALSRHADIYVCDRCGTAEALLKFMHNPLPMREWACFQPVVPPSDFKTLTADEIWDRIQAQQLGFLMDLYERWQDECECEDFADYRAAAFENCPGLTQLWASPFRAEYAAADGKLVLRFRIVEDCIEVAADITK